MTSTMTSSSTPARRSFGRPRPSLGHYKINTASSPALSSSYTTSPPPPLPTSSYSTRRPGISDSQSRKASVSQYPAGSLYTIADGKEGYGSTSTDDLGSSPFTMNPPRPAVSRNVTDDRNGNQNLEVGGLVDVPGSMHGTLKFIGEVQGKKGTFAGVELAKEYAARGKNDGDVDGIRYFTTSIKGAGIFLPSSKAYKRLSPGYSSASMPPITPSLAAFNLGGRGEKNGYSTPTQSKGPNFSQSIGPGRATSPTLKSKRPSLPRPESPLRKTQNAGSTPQNRPSLGGPKLSKSMIGGPRYAPSPVPGTFGSSVRGVKDGAGDPGKRQPITPKPAIRSTNRPTSRSESRSESRLGPEPMFDEESDNTPTAVVRTTRDIKPTQPRSRPNSNQDAEMRQLRLQLEERDKQLNAYATDLEEMQNSIAELQMATPKHASATTTRSSRGSAIDDMDAPSLRALVREKNEKIAMLTQEFDEHRKQFRGTLDTLEATSEETNRHYEERISVLQMELGELQDRGDDVEGVAQQLKLLDQQVQDLEEGLEDSRRGESEARGEVEFLRGEVERGRAELRREIEKAAEQKEKSASLKGSSRELEQRDDEIRGLKAIIHSLSRDGATPDTGSPKSSRRVSKQRHSVHNQPNGHTDPQLAEERQAREKLEQEVQDLQGRIDRKTSREEQLEDEVQRLRKSTSHVSSSSNGYSERTMHANNPDSYNHKRNSSKSSIYSQDHTSRDTTRRNQHLEPTPESDTHSTTMTDSSDVRCEVCGEAGHEIIACTNYSKPSHPNGHPPLFQADTSSLRQHHRTGRDAVHDGLRTISSPQHPGDERNDSFDAATPKAQHSRTMEPVDGNVNVVPGKNGGLVEGEKWCALCERYGHDFMDCPFESEEY